MLHEYDRQVGPHVSLRTCSEEFTEVFMTCVAGGQACYLSTNYPSSRCYGSAFGETLRVGSGCDCDRTYRMPRHWPLSLTSESKGGRLCW